MGIASTLENASTIITSVTALAAAGLAFYGIDTWRREYVGKRKADLAEEVLALFYQARDAIRSIRCPGGYCTEGQTRPGRENERPEDRPWNDWLYMPIERYMKYQEVFTRLHAMRYRFMALFGEQQARYFDELRNAVNEVLNTCEIALGDECARKRSAEIKKVIWANFAEGDELALKVDAAVKGAEDACRAAIRVVEIRRQWWRRERS